ncbi:MAG: UDP-N-acetylmuramoyl-tripeptide--D-alanyl-D-alanine ligase [Planctomycetes bacterium]|nr:UDP-N-acetylmuramoyl-tripeptide--D-alanyl-D-alanine ligase [Planctomycetota bacterium]
MRITLGEIARWADGYLTTDDVNREVTSLSTDSRTVQRGEAFLALKGPTFDGHQFVGDAIERGAAVAIVDNIEVLEGKYPGIVVPDTLAALGNIAHRSRWSEPLIPWIAITGSNGKTTTREMVACILRKRGPVATPYGNYNNRIGLPLSILGRSEDAWAGVVELGASEPGEVSALTNIAQPTIAIVTNTGPAHLEGFGSLETVAHEKGDIFERLPHDGVAIYPSSDFRANILIEHIHGNRASFAIGHGADMVAENVVCSSKGVKFTVRGVAFELSLLGEHNVMNCLAALLAAEHLGIGLAEASEALREMEAVQQRLEKTDAGAISIINDVYNANPTSLKAAVDVLCGFDEERKIVIVGDMLELGTQSRELHREVGRSLAQKELNVILAVGRQCVALAETAATSSAKTTVRHFSTVPLLIRHLSEYVSAGDVVLVKGSRGMKMEQVVTSLKKLGANLAEQ